MQAQAVISTTLGADVAAFRARRVPGGFAMAGGGVGVRFDRAGVRFSAPGGWLRLSLGAATPTAEGATSPTHAVTSVRGTRPGRSASSRASRWAAGQPGAAPT
jgi:hypothetical protein